MISLKEKIENIILLPNGEYSSARMTESFFLKNHPKLKDEVFSSTDFYSKTEIIFSRRLLLLTNNITKRITCVVCGTETNPNKRNTNGFSSVCSFVCAGKLNLGKTIKYTPEQIISIDDKRKSTMLGKYGVEYNTQRQEMKENVKNNKKNIHTHIKYELLEDKELITNWYKEYPSTWISEQCGCTYGLVLDYLRRYDVDITNHTKISKEQHILADIVGSEYCVQNSKILGNVDIDIFSEDKSFGIEYNGFPWHLESFSGRDKNYHLNKTKLAIDRDINLIHIFPHQLYGKRDIVESIINNRMGRSTKIYGRNSIIKIIETKEAKEFLDNNHLNGYVNSSIKLGLYHEELLISVMTLSKPRYDNNTNWEIIRSASKLNYCVVGGVSKLIKYFVSEYMKNGEILMTYADRSISEGKSYELAGMMYSHTTKPNYFYVNRKNNYLPESRLKYQKHKLVDFKFYDESKTEWEIMKLSGYDRYWDCGNNVYKLMKN